MTPIFSQDILTRYRLPFAAFRYVLPFLGLQPPSCSSCLAQTPPPPAVRRLNVPRAEASHVSGVLNALFASPPSFQQHFTAARASHTAHLHTAGNKGQTSAGRFCCCLAVTFSGVVLAILRILRAKVSALPYLIEVRRRD